MFVPPTGAPLEAGRPAFGAVGFPGNPAAVSPLAASLAAQQIKDTVGIIFPPADIRGIIDKTAEFVAKNGPEFEQRVLADRSNGSKFAFLIAGNPYRPYYDAKVAEFQTGEINESIQQQIPQAILARKQREAEKKQKKEQLLALTTSSSTSYDPDVAGVGDALVCLGDAAARDRTALCAAGAMLGEDERPPAPPPEDQYTAPRPFAAPVDKDVIKLTAQYVARNGQRFLVGLGQRERGNPQFSFLRTTHPLFAYFTTLVDAYTRCLVPSKTVLASLKEDIGLAGRFSSGRKRLDNNDDDTPPVGPTDILFGVPPAMKESQITAMLGILERVDARHQWESYEEKRKEEAANREAEERQQMHAMDWHEFTVVEVINFTEEDDTLPLGPPIDHSTLTRAPIIPALAPETPSLLEDLRRASLVPDLSESVAIPTSEVREHKLITDTPSVVSDSAVVTPPTALPPQPVAATIPITALPPQSGFPEVPSDSQAPSATPIVVVKDYVRQGKRRAKDTAGMQKCPITGQWIPVEQMSEHLRILLLDPKWKEEKDVLLAKAQKESAFAPLSDFEANLANFVVKRPDLFGTVEDECESNYVPPVKRHS